MHRMLIVDADGQQDVLSAVLHAEGFDVEFATSSTEALGILAASPTVNVILIDLMTPDLQGFELARQIQRVFPRVCVVLSGAFHLSARQVERANCGAVGFIPKPYNIGELCNFLRTKAANVLPAPC